MWQILYAKIGQASDWLVSNMLSNIPWHCSATATAMLLMGALPEDRNCYLKANQDFFNRKNFWICTVIYLLPFWCFVLFLWCNSNPDIIEKLPNIKLKFENLLNFVGIIMLLNFLFKMISFEKSQTKKLLVYKANISRFYYYL